MAKKLFFLDLDGTLLNDEKKISTENRKAIDRAVKLGHKVIVTTGRSLSSVLNLLPEFGLDQPGCYAITYNGGLIYDVGAKEAIYKKTMPLEQVAYVFEKAYEFGKIHIQTYTDDAFICEKDTPEGLYYEQKARCERKIVKSVIEELNGYEPCKMLAIAAGFDRTLLEGFRDAMREWADGKMEVYFSCNEYLEFTPLGIDKGAAVLWIAEYLGAKLEDTIAVGDAENDISMLQAAGIGVVMKNAPDDMKVYGDYITQKDNNEGGVAEVIEKYIAEGKGAEMAEKKYVAYVGTYTHGESKGIHIFDLDVENGKMMERKVVPINNPSYIKKSHNGKYLYSIADEGVRSYRILPDGDLEEMNSMSIQGMRGCYLSTDKDDKYLFVAGWHDGKVTVMRLNEDGTVGEMTDEIFHKGIGSVAERNFMPHVNSVNLTPDGKYLCAVDSGIDQVKIYKFDNRLGKIKLVDILRCELESAPRTIKFSRNGKFCYLICGLKNYISVYSYVEGKRGPKFELIQTVPTLNEYHAGSSSACALRFSKDDTKLLITNAGDNSAGLFHVDNETGLLEKICILPVSGDYPKAVDFFPDNQHIMSFNHEANSITVFKVDYEKKYFTLCQKPIKIETPNCVLVSEVAGE